MASTFNLKVITPDGIKFNDDAVSIEATTAKGRIGIYAHHVNLIATLRSSIIAIKSKNNQREEYVITSGHLFFENNEAKVITNKFLKVKDVNVSDINKEIDDYKNQLKQYNEDSLVYKMINERIKNNQQVLALIKK